MCQKSSLTYTTPSYDNISFYFNSNLSINGLTLHLDLEKSQQETLHLISDLNYLQPHVKSCQLLGFLSYVCGDLCAEALNTMTSHAWLGFWQPKISLALIYYAHPITHVGYSMLFVTMGVRMGMCTKSTWRTQCIYSVVMIVQHCKTEELTSGLRAM